MNAIRFSGLAILAAGLTAAQVTATVAAITRIEGTVYLNDRTITSLNTPFADGLIRTVDGRAEIRLQSGTLFIGENSVVRIIDNAPWNFNRLVLEKGSVVVTTNQGSGSILCEDSVTLSDAGVFRLDIVDIPDSPYREKSCRVKVYEGAASVKLASTATVLRSGKTMNLNQRAGDMIPREDFNIAEIDSLDRWSRRPR